MNRWILFGLHELEGVGWKTIALLADKVKDLRQVPEMSAAELGSYGVLPRQAQIIAAKLTDAHIEKSRLRYAKSGVQMLTVYDDAYPDLLKELHGYPLLFYYRGNVSLLTKPCIAIVGTRLPTVYGKRTARELASSLSEAGFAVVSGMARGIDREAHLGALAHEGGTIAVLASGLDVIYPREHHELQARIAREGLLISEYPLGAQACTGCFPQRNRIIAGLSLGTVVVEAAEKSGALITADLALEASRDVFCVPGPIHSPKSKGTNAYIREGAYLTRHALDIAEQFVHLVRPDFMTDQPKARPAITDPDELAVLGMLMEKTQTIDELLQKSKITFGQMHTILLSLQMRKKIAQCHGSTYMYLSD